MTSLLRVTVLSCLVACVDRPAPIDDMDLVEDADDDLIAATPENSPSWQIAPTLHAGSSTFDHVDAGARRVHSLWVAGSSTTPVPLTINAAAAELHDVRIAVLGPLVNGVRPVLAADGYSSSKRVVSVSLSVVTPGEHLVVVGSYGLLHETFYDIDVQCTGSGGCVATVDVLATPKDGGLVGDAQNLVQMTVGAVLIGRDFDVEVELWAGPPMQTWNTELVAVSTASGSQINAIAPASLQAGDDIRLVVREAGGRVLDSGVMTRFAPGSTAFARLDSILYGDLTSLQIAGVVGFFEGIADLSLRSEARHIELANHTLHADRPGQVGNGLNAFDATFIPDLAVGATDGELLSIGYINGNGDYHRLGCFEYCNNLSGTSSCTGGPRSCP